MALRFLGGVLSGAAASAIGLAALSLSVPVPGQAPTEVPGAAPETAPAAPVVSSDAPSGAPEVLRPEAAPAVGTTPVEAPDAPGGEPAPGAISSLVPSETGGVPIVLVAPPPDTRPDLSAASLAGSAALPRESPAPLAELAAPVVGDVASETAIELPDTAPDSPTAEAPAARPEAPASGGAPKVAPEVAPEAEAPQPQSAAPASEPAPAPGALQRNAAAFEVSPRARLVGVVLIDDGLLPGPVAISLLSLLPGPVSLALDPSRRDALERAGPYRAAGHEVMADLRAGAAPGPLAEQVVGVILPEPGARDGLDIGPDMGLAQLLAARAPASAGASLAAGPTGAAQPEAGRVLPATSPEDGLQSPRRLAFDLGSVAQNDAAIGRFLDAMSADSEPGRGVILQAPLSLASVQAIVAWQREQGRGAGQVAPISAVLLQTDGAPAAQ